MLMMLDRRLMMPFDAIAFASFAFVTPLRRFPAPPSRHTIDIAILR